MADQVNSVPYTRLPSRPCEGRCNQRFILNGGRRTRTMDACSRCALSMHTIIHPRANIAALEAHCCALSMHTLPIIQGPITALDATVCELSMHGLQSVNQSRNVTSSSPFAKLYRTVSVRLS